MIREEVKQVITTTIFEVIKTINGTQVNSIMNDEEIMVEIDSLVGFNLVRVLGKKLNLDLPDSFLCSKNLSSLNMIVDTFLQEYELGDNNVRK